MSELALDDDQRHALACELYRVRVPELVRRDAPADARPDGGLSQVGPGGGA